MQTFSFITHINLSVTDLYTVDLDFSCEPNLTCILLKYILSYNAKVLSV